MVLSPSAGSIKTRKTRVVPLHQDLLDQGFVDWVQAKGQGPLFYNAEGAKRNGGSAGNPARPRSVKTRERLAAWIRSIGVRDIELSPTHGWRHLFKLKCDRVGISEKISDAITGHAPANIARSYGQPTIEDMARELAKFPRYEL